MNPYPHSIQMATELKKLAYANGMDMFDLQGAAMVIVEGFCLVAVDQLQGRIDRHDDRCRYSMMALGLRAMSEGIDAMKRDKGETI